MRKRAKPRKSLLLWVLLLGLSAPLYGESASSETVTLTEQEWKILQEEYTGLKSDLTELQAINSNQLNLINKLERLQKNSETLMSEQKILLVEQQSELLGLKISSERLIADIARQETLTNRWKTMAIVGGSIAGATLITMVVLFFIPQ